MEAQRYPEDFDGIIAGDPANPQIALHASTVARSVDTFKDSQGFIPREKIVNVLAPAVMKACDAVDGVKDNLISNPWLASSIRSVAFKSATGRIA